MPAQLSAEAAAVVRVRVPSPLRSYTDASVVDVAVPVLAPELPPSLKGVLAALDLSYPGMRFRMIDEQGHVRRHIKIFVGGKLVRDLATPIHAGQEVLIVAALSGG
jgi:molybdopterin synthase sulfur carrier subunit